MFPCYKHIYRAWQIPWTTHAAEPKFIYKWEQLRPNLYAHNDNTLTRIWKAEAGK